MQIPNYQSFMPLVLETLSNGQTKQLKEIFGDICLELKFSPEQLKARIPSGKQTILYHRISWQKPIWLSLV